MQFELPKEKSSIIKVIGVGGGGSNAVNHMYRQGIKGVDFIVCNTDSQALDVSPVPNKVQLGLSLTEGMGAGSIPEVGKNAAIETIEDIRSMLQSNTKMVFITAGMGGGTGTGAAPIIAEVAREMGILTVGIVTVPFSFEGKKRKSQAEEGIEQLKKSVDTLLIICNEKLREMYGNLSLTSAFAHADNILTTAAKGIAEIITVTGNINVDFKDVKTVMTSSGVAIMGSAMADGENRAVRAVQHALASPLLNDSDIKGAQYILLNISSGNKEVTMDEIGEITDYIQEEAGQTAEIIWGYNINDILGDNISITIIATGFKTKQEIGVEQKNNERIVHDLANDSNSMRLEKPQPVEIINEEEEISQESSSMEPVLIRKSENSEEQISFEFEIGNSSNNQPIIFNLEEDSKDRDTSDKTSAVHPVDKESKEDPIDIQLQRSKERIMKLKELSLKIKSPSGIADLEKEPAYKRKNIKLDATTPASQSDVSRFTLSEDEEKKPEIRPNNSFLHDKVD